MRSKQMGQFMRSGRIPADRLNRVKSKTSGPVDVDAEFFSRAIRASKGKPKSTEDSGDLAWVKKGILGIAFIGAITILPGYIPGLRPAFLEKGRANPVIEEHQRLAGVNCLVMASKPGPENDRPWSRDDSVMVELIEARDALSELTDRCSDIQSLVSKQCQQKDLYDHSNALANYLDLRRNTYEAAYKKSGRGGIEFLNTHFQNRTDVAIINDHRVMVRDLHVMDSLAPPQKRYLELLLKHHPEPVPICTRLGNG